MVTVAVTHDRERKTAMDAASRSVAIQPTQQARRRGRIVGPLAVRFIENVSNVFAIQNPLKWHWSGVCYGINFGHSPDDNRLTEFAQRDSLGNLVVQSS